MQHHLAFEGICPRAADVALAMLSSNAVRAVRITARPEATRLVVSVEGNLDAAGSALLRREVERTSSASIVLDLSGLVAFDDEGLAAIRALVESGARTEGASRFVEAELARGAGHQPNRVEGRAAVRQQERTETS
jgi:hypothetical protein